MVADGKKGVVEDVIGDVAALGDGRGLVELPVDAEVNPALAIFFFSLRESGEAARHERTHVAGVVFGNAVEFVGDKGERDVIRGEKSAHRLEDGAAKTAVTRWITWKRWSEVRTSEIASGRADWRECRVARRVRVAIAEHSWAGSGIGFANASDRSPEIVKVFRIPNRNTGVGHRGINEREQACQLDRIEIHLVSDVDRDLIIETRRRAKTRGSIVGPEDANETLFGCARGRCVNTIATD